ncbi:MAG: ATP-binding cassette domain-containing protein [Proteobacteria bacterium]|jgi:ATP-binding cassette subfamily F protein uup|nr:ATP-binding cassette domain-containing protein [Pseudomonadota bacterium]
MALAPLLQLNDVSVSFGGNPLFSKLHLVVHPRDRLVLVGRNGSGKSTLMKIMAGQIEPDTGTRIVSPGVKVSYMEQDPDMSSFSTLGDYACSSLSDEEIYKLEVVSEGLKLNLGAQTNTASGGERRRAALAKLLAEEPELMLLDEPTNHLDIEAISWLESELFRTSSAFILISHDRTFLNALSRGILWIDRGQIKRKNDNFQGFENWRDKTWEEEDTNRHKLDQKIKSEGRWAAEGISGRRKRNMGRVRALKDFRAQKSDQITRPGLAAMAFGEGPASGRQTIVANKIFKSFGSKALISNFSIKVARGDRVAIVGPNGAGKTTLIKLLMGELKPDSGTVKLGTNQVLAIFDQNREELDPDSTLWESLTNSSDTGAMGKSDFVMVRGKPKHVVGYLKEFLFDDRQLRSPVRSLSGGEKARLLLARIMAKESNFLILDEPTNDLDMETLDLLQELVSDYQGTVLIVSHDRDFIDRVATSTVVLGSEQIIAYAGGWSDYLSQSSQGQVLEEPYISNSKKNAGRGKTLSNKILRKDDKLTFTEMHRLTALPDEISDVENEIKKLVEILSDSNLYIVDASKFSKVSEALSKREKALVVLEGEWLRLEEKREK